MKLKSIVALFTFIISVEGAFWAAALNPVILSLGAVFGAINTDLLNIESIEWNLPFMNKNDKDEKDELLPDEKGEINISAE